MGWPARFLATPATALLRRRGWSTSSPIASVAGFWVAFVGRTVMFRNLPRHQFGSLQGKMFPAYFMLILLCSAISVAAFIFQHPWKTAPTVERYELGLLTALGYGYG
ncbi:unnamed protein product [Urochloa humidicola]